MPLNGACRLTRNEMEYIDHSIEFINLHFFKPITAVQLADEFNVNIRKLHAGFRKKTGSTVHNYLLKVRLDQAKKLLMDPDEPGRQRGKEPAGRHRGRAIGTGG